jgi:hypothetical protein
MNKTQTDYTWHNFPNIGYITSSLTDEQLKLIHEEINEIQSDFKNSSKANDSLAGHIEHEYDLCKSRNYVEQLVLPYIIAYEKEFNYNKLYGTYTLEDCPWVNFQKKHEFNPMHIHFGSISFVIWIKIPYSNDEEQIKFKKNGLKNSTAGNFNLHYANTLGNLSIYSLPVDKTWENKIIIFPSRMNHSVNPFYTSDEYRISVSGNFIFKNI